MPTRPDGGAPETLSPDDAFALLGHELRIGILQALWEAYDPSAGDDGLPFSALYDRVDTDDTGNFNYHLGKLAGRFVRRTDDGYRLTGSGHDVVRSVVAGTVSRRPVVEPHEIAEACPRCDAPVEVEYVDQTVLARCSSCPGFWQSGADGSLFAFGLPPAGLEDRTPETAFHATVEYNLHRIASFRSGVCPDCSGAVASAVDACEAHDPREEGGCPACSRQHLAEVSDRCTRCKSSVRGPLTIAILSHPSITAFYHDHGVEHRFQTWEAFGRAQTIDEELVGTDPLRVRVTVPCEGDELQLTLDESLSPVADAG